MTAEELIANARENRTGPTDPTKIDPSTLSEFLGFALEHLLEDIDYERDTKSSAAIAARVLATIGASCADCGSG